MVAFELEVRLLRAAALQPTYSLIHCTCLRAGALSLSCSESKGSQRHSLLACPPFIFLTIFLESNEQYEYIKAVLQPGGTLQVCPAGGGGGRWMFFMWKLREKLCSRETCPTVEALSWLSVPSPSSVSLCVCWNGERAVTDCFVLS